MKFSATGIVIAKKINKATNEFIKDGVKYPAKDKSYSLFLAVGDMDDTSAMFFNNERPQLLEVKISQADYQDIKKQSAHVCKIEQKNANYKILRIDGIEIFEGVAVAKKTADDSADDEDEGEDE